MFNLKGCPHCGKDSTIRRVQSSDELNWTLLNEDLKELWQCEECAGYFIVEYKTIKVVSLIPKI